jgi:hypothetical protein
VLGFIVRVVLNFAEAQRVGVETVFIGGGGGVYHRTLLPGVLTCCHIKTVPCRNPYYRFWWIYGRNPEDRIKAG